ncbi:hypothetical protein CUJ84_Chr002963 [Rhizobium leguminosarum]|uniref:Uncharacterized protein n=1 Tax=Rhizobium leguminosarum TaxID=384 RepID=A0A2K9Z4Z8_RHILE|nr:hypothetical protein CUJ84_Chr002963 [Rhizobium leguminosarum]
MTASFKRACKHERARNRIRAGSNTLPAGATARPFVNTELVKAREALMKPHLNYLSFDLRTVL